MLYKCLLYRNFVLLLPCKDYIIISKTNRGLEDDDWLKLFEKFFLYFTLDLFSFFECKLIKILNRINRKYFTSI
jgi:hypothetical protein